MKERLENQAQSESAPDDRQDGGEKKTSRRDFLKTLGKAALVGGAAALSVDRLVEGVKKHNEKEKEDTKHEQSGEGTIAEKSEDRFTPPDSLLRYKIRVRFEDKEGWAQLTKEEFDACHIGGKIPLVYDDRNKDIWKPKTAIYGYEPFVKEKTER
jgi:hypothetical protein